MTTAPPTPRIAGWSLLVIAIVASVAALKLAESLLAPIFLGLVIGVVLAPLVKQLRRLGVPVIVSAFSALVFSGALLVVLIFTLGPVVSELIDQIPRLQFELRIWLQQLAAFFQPDAMNVDLGGSLGDDGEDAVADAMPSLLDALWLAPNFMAQLLMFAGTVFFFLITRDELYDLSQDGKPAFAAADRAVSHYFVTIALINGVMGVAVFGVMTLIGLPNPILWGAAAFLMNFVLYLGPMLLIAALLIAGMVTFNGILSFAPPIAFVIINLTEAQFVTPTLVGQRMKINPLGVFLAILFGLWLWGPIGGIVALPILVWFTALVTALQRINDEAPTDRGLRAA